MSILELNKVDIASVRSLEGKTELILTLVDQLDWEDEFQHLKMLQEKIYNYADFYTDKQYKKIPKFKKIKPTHAVIEIIFLHPITPNCEKFLNSISNVIGEEGIFIKVEIQPPHIMEGVREALNKSREKQN